MRTIIITLLSFIFLMPAVYGNSQSKLNEPIMNLSQNMTPEAKISLAPSESKNTFEKWKEMNDQKLQKRQNIIEQGIKTSKQRLQQIIKLREQIKRAKKKTQLNWVAVQGGKIPKKAKLAGYGYQRPLYICQANYLGGIHPGFVDGTGCRITYGGQSFLISDYKVLLEDHLFAWRPKNELYTDYYHQWPEKMFTRMPVVGGHESNGKLLYLCRGIVVNEIRVGKVLSQRCNVSWQGREIRLKTYQVLFV